MAIIDGIIRLNVGGKIFQTTSQTLCKEPDSFLGRFCKVDEMQPSVKDDSGSFFIDRDPRYFRVILNYLRSSVVDLEDNVSLDALRAEADFYCLSGLARRLEDMRDIYFPKRESSLVKTVWVTTHQGTGKALRDPTLNHKRYDTSYTAFASTDAKVLTRIASTDTFSKHFPKHSIKSFDRELHCKDCKLDKLDVCDILGKCGLVLRFTKEKSEDDVEFFFSSV